MEYPEGAARERKSQTRKPSYEIGVPVVAELEVAAPDHALEDIYVVVAKNQNRNEEPNEKPSG
jgi:hypothetical protein